MRRASWSTAGTGRAGLPLGLGPLLLHHDLPLPLHPLLPLHPPPLRPLAWFVLLYFLQIS